MAEKLQELRLKIHVDKARITPVETGTDWLGYRVFPSHRRLRKSNVRRFRRRLRRLALAYAKGELALGKVKSSVLSWIAHAAHADTWGLRRKIFEEMVFQRG